MSTLFILLFGALLLDIIFGDLPNPYHPVCLIGSLAQKVETLCRRLGESRPVGGLAYLIVVAVPIAIVVFLMLTIKSIAPLQYTLSSLLLYFSIAPKGLARHALQVKESLQKESLQESRKAVSMIVGRDTSNLSAAGVSRACIESVAENLTDGVLSPLFWFVVGYLLSGSLGAAIAVVLYRITNTLDAMWGHKNNRYKTFGTASARMDDLLNLLPARLAVLSISIGATLQPKLSGLSAVKTALRDGHKHDSPNAGWTEASFAGALNLQLNGPVIYGTTTVEHPWLGEGTREATAEDISKAVSLMWFTTIITALLIPAILFAITTFIKDIL